MIGSEETTNQWGGFSTDEETLVKLGFQSHDSDLTEEVGIEETRVKRKRKKKQGEEHKPLFQLKDYFADFYDEMDEEEFKSLFQFPNEPIFCTKEIYENIEEFLDITWEEQERKINEMKRKKKRRKKKNRDQVKNYTPKRRFNRIPKSIKSVFKRIRLKDLHFVRIFERELSKFISSSNNKEQEEDEGEVEKKESLYNNKQKMFVRFRNPFEKFLSIGICKYYLLETKHNQKKKVLVIKKFPDHPDIPLPEKLLVDYLCEINEGLKLEKEKSDQNSEKKESGDDENFVVDVRMKDNSCRFVQVQEHEYFKIGQVVEGKEENKDENEEEEEEEDVKVGEGNDSELL